jgi:DNA polymerase-3 subunit alpha
MDSASQPVEDRLAGRFVHLDVATAYSHYRSPSLPEAYIQALGRQYPIDAASDGRPRPAIAISDYGLHAAVKTAVACDRAGVDHIVGLRVRVVPERAYQAWGERAGELILLAMDESGWLSLVGLVNRGFLSGADRGRPRVDFRDLETYREGLIALTGMPGGGGLLSAAIEQSADPAEPIEAYGLARRLMELYPNRLYLELAFHGNAAEKLVNRGLVAIGQRMQLPLVATNAVRFVRPEDALAHKVLEAIGHGSVADGMLGHAGRDGFDLPTLTVEAVRSQAYLKTPKQMWRAFAQLPAALHATLEIAERCKFRLPLARRRLSDQPGQPLGPGLLFGLEPARELGEQQLAALVEQALPERCVQTGRRAPSAAILERARAEVRTICDRGLADLLLFASEVGQFCAQHRIPLAARGSATASLVVWGLGLADLCPLDYDLDGRMFVHKGREDLPDLDLEVSSLHEHAVSTFVQQGGFEGLPAHAAGEFPHLRAIRVGVHVSMGARQAVRAVGNALGMEAPRVNTVARQVPVLSSPGAIDNVMLRAPELGIPEVGAGVEPYNTLVQVAGRLEGLPHRYGAHPSAYTFSFYGPGALDWLPAQWVSAGAPGKRRVLRGPPPGRRGRRAGRGGHARAPDSPGQQSPVARLAARP